MPYFDIPKELTQPDEDDPRFQAILERLTARHNPDGEPQIDFFVHMLAHCEFGIERGQALIATTIEWCGEASPEVRRVRRTLKLAHRSSRDAVNKITELRSAKTLEIAPAPTLIQ
jgi:hypothetical protein